MKTDKEKLIDLFTEWGVGFTLSDGNTITCLEGGSKISGYFDFFTEFIFDVDGKFIEMAAGE